ncbi:hypothetical protein [Nitratiruptor sp. YY09-18]|uniref:hypothetical protein n=1 Tax=Nitratiruptor sp. YY09-18 TaxID=2724901 RepID=UPI001915899D|nr:hypothetical protein [Nitratiruptor sp. YY09-18]BCD68297.1 hypothetical protein NitYY0918_C1208 [Nitratiruptor sp. YY09-18]
MTFNKEYRNIYLVTAILLAFIIFMITTTYFVIQDVTSKRSCVKTCQNSKMLQLKQKKVFIGTQRDRG